MKSVPGCGSTGSILKLEEMLNAHLPSLPRGDGVVASLIKIYNRRSGGALDTDFIPPKRYRALASQKTRQSLW